MEKFVCNITFVMAHGQEARFLKWMREEAAGVMFLSEMAECNPRLHTVLEAGGEKPGPDHGLSIALQLDFATEEAAHSWHDNALPPVLRDYHQKFGPHALFFITLLKQEPLL